MGVKVDSPAYDSVKKGEVEFLDVITEVNGELCIMESEYQESVRSKTQPQLTLKRHGAMPSIKKLLSEGELYAVCFSYRDVPHTCLQWKTSIP